MSRRSSMSSPVVQHHHKHWCGAIDPLTTLRRRTPFARQRKMLTTSSRGAVVWVVVARRVVHASDSEVKFLSVGTRSMPAPDMGGIKGFNRDSSVNGNACEVNGHYY